MEESTHLNKNSIPDTEATVPAKVEITATTLAEVDATIPVGSEAPAPTLKEKKRPDRLLALDILRGITIAGMILVNNPGDWGHIYAPLKHAEWHGLTPTDLVFPFFMFIMGVSTYFSLRKYNFEFSKSALIKILRRSAVIFLIGFVLVWIVKILAGTIRENMSIMEAMFGQFDTIRVLGVLPRLAICYGVGSLVALAFHGRQKAIACVVGVFLVGYALILILGDGLDFASYNVIARVDYAVLGQDHMYIDTVAGKKLVFDPEGLLSTLPSIAHMLIGFLMGGMIVRVKDNTLRINNLFIVGAILTFAGFLLSYGIPINKKIWSPTFVLTTCGLASSLLGLLIWIIDIKGYKKWCRFFEAFGVNPLFMFVIGSLGGTILGFIYVAPKISLKMWLYKDVWTPLAGGDEILGSLYFALTYIAFIWIFGYILYKKKIYIKI